jgi:hypothetical protein
MKYWEIIADNLKKAGWSLGWVSAVASKGRTMFVADAHRGDAFVVYADEKVALCFFAAAAVSFADDPQMGTWKLNEAKSKFAPSVPKNHTVVYETAGDNVKITVDGTDKDGKSTHNEWTGKFDGKDYPVTGDPASDMRSYQKVGDRILKMKIKKDGKVTITGRIIVSADGKSRIVTTSEAGAKDKGFRNRSVYDKQ